MALTVTRNPNLMKPLAHSAGSDPKNSANEIQKLFGKRWWTGLPPEECPGFDRERQCLVALPLLNLNICTRQDILDYFNNTWTLTELLFAALKNESVYTRPPYHQLRHPLIFYYGHPAVLFINKLRLAGLVKAPLNLYLEKVLETGVDEMSWDDLAKNEMNWPSVEAIHAYRKQVYEIITEMIQTHPDLDRSAGAGLDRDFGPSSPLWALWMGFEHEKIHIETSSVLIRELPAELVETPKYWPPLHPTALKEDHFLPRMGSDFQATEWRRKDACKVQVGKKLTTESFGWDNEYGERAVSLQGFQYTKNQITNGEYFEFVRSGAFIQDKYWSSEGLQWRKFRNIKRPAFWAAVGPEGAHEYQLRTLFEYIPMPWDWPVEVNFHEAQAFCKWKKEQDQSALQYRLLSEAEFVSLRNSEQRLHGASGSDPVLQKRSFREYKNFDEIKPNFNLRWGSAGRGHGEIDGNVWHWLEDQFNPLPGFAVHSLYDDFSTPCFDGKHQMIAGGSFISSGHEASHWARFHFRPHFYQHAGFRIAANFDGGVENGAVKLLHTEEYVHSRRSNVLDQIKENPDWWRGFEQPLELNAQELQNLFAVTQKNVLEFNAKFASMSPMGSAHDPTINSVPKEFSLPYQTTKNFPAHAESYEKLVKFIFDEMAPLSQLPGHPGYVAYVAGAGNMISNTAQLISQTLNPFSGHYMMAPGLVTLEAEVIQWFIDLFKLPVQSAGGFLTTGSSLATQSALAMARQKKWTSKDYSKVTLYVCDQAHHCAAKAWVTLGFAGENIRFVKSSRPNFKMDLEHLEQLIHQDLKAGMTPLCVIGSAGTTNTGAVDDLKGLARIANKHKVWFHIDGAYGALFALSGKTHELLAGLELADSLVFDLHKALALSYGTGCLLVRDKQDMKISYPGAKTYMPPEIEDGGFNLRVDFADISPELSRDYRGLRVWLPIKTLGIGPFVLNLEEKLQLSSWLSSELKKIPHIEMVAEPQLSIQAFTLNFGSDVALNNEKTQKLLEEINRRGTLFVSACMIDGRKCIRLCLLGFRLHYALLEKALKEIRDILA